MIEANLLIKKFGSLTAVDEVSFKAPSGEIFGIAGPNGAGKSTIVKMIATILSPTSGNALIDGLDLRKDALGIRRIVGYLPEEPRVYDYLSGRNFLRYFANIYGVKNTDSRIKEMLEFVGLSQHADRKIGDYSKGMKQRISVARTLIHDPKVLILDEPTMGLDPASARELREKVLGLRDEGKTILICTHYMDEADFLCDRLAILNQGKIAAIGKPEELKRKVASRPRISIVLGNANKKQENSFISEVGAKRRGRLLTMDALDLSKALGSIQSASRKFKVEILSVKSIEPTLDDAFIEVTKKG